MGCVFAPLHHGEYVSEVHPVLQSEVIVNDDD
jgi:hypothetical protein